MKFCKFIHFTVSLKTVITLEITNRPFDQVVDIIKSVEDHAFDRKSKRKPVNDGLTCTEICSNENAIIPNYDQWNTLNISRLFDSCEDWNCDFTIKSKYDFIKSQWESNGKKLDKIIWKSSSYPRLNDVLTVCRIRSNNGLQYCLASSNEFELTNRTNYVGYQYRDSSFIYKYSNINRGYYF